MLLLFIAMVIVFVLIPMLILRMGYIPRAFCFGAARHLPTPGLTKQPGLHRHSGVS